MVLDGSFLIRVQRGFFLQVEVVHYEHTFCVSNNVKTYSRIYNTMNGSPTSEPGTHVEETFP